MNALSGINETRTFEQKLIQDALRIHAKIYLSQINNKMSNAVSSTNSDGPTEPKVRKTQENPKKNIGTLYERTLNEMKEAISAEAVSVCLTIDESEENDKTFVAITAHYLDNDFEMKNVLLQCKDVADTQMHIKGVIEEWDLKLKITHVVAKSVSILELVKLFDIDNLQYSLCCLETINDIMVEALTPMETLFENLKTVANSINRNVRVLKKFCDFQIEMDENKKPKLLLRPVGRCWRSKYHVLQRFNSLKDAVKVCLNDFDNINVSDKEWEDINQLFEVLRPVIEVTSFLCERYMPHITASTALILTNSIISICDDLEGKTNDSVKKVVQSIKEQLDNFYAVDSDFIQSFGVCLFLDPRFKTYGFRNEKDVFLIKSHMYDLVEAVSDTEELENFEDITAWKQFEALVRKKKPSSNDDITKELTMYAKEDLLPRKIDGKYSSPAKWWKDRKTTYPILSQLYRRKCNIVGTVVQTERLLVDAKKLLEQCEVGSTLDELAFLNINLDKENNGAE